MAEGSTVVAIIAMITPIRSVTSTRWSWKSQENFIMAKKSSVLTIIVMATRIRNITSKKQTINVRTFLLLMGKKSENIKPLL